MEQRDDLAYTYVSLCGRRNCLWEMVDVYGEISDDVWEQNTYVVVSRETTYVVNNVATGLYRLWPVC